MFATIRRHQKWFWVAIIAVIIPSFVIFFTPDASLRGFGASNDFGSINGRPISQDEYYDAWRETALYFFLNYGTMPKGDESTRFGFDQERETRTRVLLIRKLKDLNVHVNEEATVQWITNAFFDRRQGAFRPENYDQFVRKIAQEGIRERDFERFVGHQVGIQQLIATFGLAGTLVTPQEAATLYRREHEEVQAEAIIFSSTSYLAKVTITTNALTQFYNERQVGYRTPDRVQVSYVKFDRTNFLAEADQQMAKITNLTQMIDAKYMKDGANFYVDTNGAVMPEAAAKAKIKEDVRKDFALSGALKKASIFATDLFKMTPVKADNLAKLASSNSLPVQISEPFSSYEGPKDLKVPGNFSTIAFKLTPEDPFAPPISGEEAVYVIAFGNKIPSELPPLDTIKAKVETDYRREQELLMARQEGDAFYQKLTNSLALGKTFEKFCEEAKVTPVKIPKFSHSTSDLPQLDSRLDLGQVKDVSNSLAAGKTSPFASNRDGGFILHVLTRQPADETAMKKELPDTIKSMQKDRVGLAFNEWLSREISLARVTGPPPPKTKSKENPKSK